jgi:hypothetical protein
MERSETARCNTCKAITTWSGRGKRLFCSGCGTDFPCARECGHWDCMEATGRAVADSNGILRIVSKACVGVATASDGAARVEDDHTGCGAFLDR